MPRKYKLKTKRGACKRFKKTASGKIRFRRANRNHINTKRSTKQVRKARQNGIMADCDGKKVSEMIG